MCGAKNRDTVRLNKAIASTGFCSRRKADALIFSGRVQVNGRPEQNPARSVGIEDKISVDGRPLAQRQVPICVLLHKPVHVVCTAHDPEGRRTVLDCLPESLRGHRLFPVGRLDYFSEGLLLLTNDGALAHRLMHPSRHQAKIYEVLVRGRVGEDALRAMRSGMTLAEGEKLAPIAVRASLDSRGDTLLTLTLHQGVNRQLRRMCRDLNLTILRLKRVSQGILELDGLPVGKARLLDADETSRLRQSLGLDAEAHRA
ncbi:MAG: rRNA pseudouridine synthase [Desulfovibrio sp.]|nr:rRNA pseudouridine synthase [Desulfovibrio sp.]